jgi:hypothetical protein
MLEEAAGRTVEEQCCRKLLEEGSERPIRQAENEKGEGRRCEVQLNAISYTRI